VKVSVTKLHTCRCGDVAGGILKAIRDGFENRPGAKIHIRSTPVASRARETRSS
jgi:hypothetical protein